jgi:hypothetical protein
MNSTDHSHISIKYDVSFENAAGGHTKLSASLPIEDAAPMIARPPITQVEDIQVVCDNNQSIVHSMKDAEVVGAQNSSPNPSR